MITHKFGEVSRFADDVSVLRKGRLVGSTQVSATSQEELATWMMGASEAAAEPASQQPVDRDAAPRLEVCELSVANDKGTLAVSKLSLDVRPGEIVGIAGISGNGQRELTEALLGQRQSVSGEIRINGAPYQASRREMQREKVFSLPEEPLRNACIAGMSVADNLALRNFDQPPLCRQGWLINRKAIQTQAEALIEQFNVRPADPLRPIGTLSGGNVQRAVLARELTHDVRTLIVSNPVFGLDFASVAIIHQRLRDARAQGAAVLLLSEDLDELLEMSDRILVIHEGEINFEVAADQADRATLGHYMAGADHTAGAA